MRAIYLLLAVFAFYELSTGKAHSGELSRVFEQIEESEKTISLTVRGLIEEYYEEEAEGSPSNLQKTFEGIPFVSVEILYGGGPVKIEKIVYVHEDYRDVFVEDGRVVLVDLPKEIFSEVQALGKLIVRNENIMIRQIVDPGDLFILTHSDGDEAKKFIIVDPPAVFYSIFRLSNKYDYTVSEISSVSDFSYLAMYLSLFDHNELMHAMGIQQKIEIYLQPVEIGILDILRKQYNGDMIKAYGAVQKNLQMDDTDSD